MKITPSLFHAHIKCPTKCWLRFTGEPATGNAYAEWVQRQNESYRDAAIERLRSEVPQDDCAVAPAQASLKTSKWRLGFDVLVAPSQNLETRLHAVERVLPEGRGQATRFIPIRFVFTNKLGKDEKLLLAFDAFVLSEILRREVSLAKIIHGDDRFTLKVKARALAGEVLKRIEKITALLSNPSAPDLILNRHCTECEFQARCRRKAMEQDDLSLLAGMSEKERQKFRAKGIFTITQLSYTFRPRRRSKRLRDKREKYQHSLKALAIREKKIHIVGNQELKIEGTPVYLDVEGLPDRDFYYLIGVRIGNGDSAVQHSLWADTVADERKIWREFLGILEAVEQPVLIHYGISPLPEPPGC
jgi:predicted RecB family nuclease